MEIIFDSLPFNAKLLCKFQHQHSYGPFHYPQTEWMMDSLQIRVRISYYPMEITSRSAGQCHNTSSDVYNSQLRACHIGLLTQTNLAWCPIKPIHLLYGPELNVGNYQIKQHKYRSQIQILIIQRVWEVCHTQSEVYFLCIFSFSPFNMHDISTDRYTMQ